MALEESNRFWIVWKNTVKWLRNDSQIDWEGRGLGRKEGSMYINTSVLTHMLIRINSGPEVKVKC